MATVTITGNNISVFHTEIAKLKLTCVPGSAQESGVRQILENSRRGSVEGDRADQSSGSGSSSRVGASQAVPEVP